MVIKIDLFVIFFLSISINLFAQNGQIDSLQRLLLEDLQPEVKAEIASNLCFHLCYSNSDTAWYYGQWALAIGKQLKSDKIIGKAYNRLGIVKDVISQWDSALVYYNKALKFALKARDSITISSVYNNYGLIYWNKGELDKAIENFTKSIRIAEEINNLRMVASNYNNIGLVYYDQKRYMKSYNTQMKALQIRKQIGDTYGIGASLTNIGLVLEDLNKVDSSIIYLQRAIQVKKQINDLYGLGKAYADIGISLFTLKNYDSAFYYLNKSIRQHLAVENYYNATSTYLNIGSLYHDLKNEKFALIYTDSAWAMAEKYHFDKLKYKLLANKAKSYYRLGDFRKAYRLLKISNSAKDSIYQMERERAIAEVQAQYNLEKKDKAIAEIKKNEAENELQIANQKLKLNRRNWLIGGVSSISLISILMILIVFIRKESKQKELKDKAIIEERERGIKAIIEATEKERIRIAKDLHDGVSQQITALKMNLQKMGAKLSPDELSALNHQVEATGNDVRNISHQMMPFSLERFGLVPALGDMLKQCFEASEMEFEFDHIGFENRLVPEIELTLFRICQELINNIIKHANATKVGVQLLNRNNKIILIVEDNGKGIKIKKDKKGIGLLNIENRLKVYNGDFIIENNTGSGTRATCRIVLEKIENNG